MLVVIDNYDSFTYNLVQYLQMLQVPLKVIKNDAASLDQLVSLSPSLLLISPGPCSPNEAGISMAAIRHFAGRIPILGVCLGHQCIAQAFSGQVASAKQIMHGKTSEINHHGQGLFAGLPSPMVVNRYHSLAVTRLPDDFQVTAVSEDGEIMAIAHNHWPIYGVQFHPESILTEHGLALMENFVALATE